MADQFQTYDKNAIIGNSLTFRAWRLGFREVVLGGLTLFLLLLCLVLAGVLGHLGVLLHDAQAKSARADNACKSNSCLKAAAHMMDFVNFSVNPCENFYQFACSGFKEKNPLDEYTLYQSVIKQIAIENRNRLLAILQSSVKRLIVWSSERKAKHFYQSCTDDFRRDELKGKPFISQVVPKLGGWYVTNPSWDASAWNMDNSLKATQADLWVDALFAPRHITDRSNRRKRIISIYPGGSGYQTSWSDYAENPTPRQAKIQKSYKAMMKGVATLLARDAGLPSNQDLSNRIDVFVADAFDVESRIAKFASNSRYQQDYHTDEKKMTLDELTRKTGGEIDWASQMSYLFIGAGVTGDTKVVLPYATYLPNITAMIRSLDPAVRNRKLNNYFVWRTAESFSYIMSSEYRHYIRQFAAVKSGPRKFWTVQQVCFMVSKWFFQDALGAIYIQFYFQQKNKKKVTDITETMRTAYEDAIRKNSWMDEATKTSAIAKMRSVTYKLGYPDFMADESQVDAIYQEVNINSTDYVGNYLSMTQHHRRRWGKELLNGKDRSTWSFAVFYVYMYIHLSWNQIVAPAGVLQFPVYTYDMPHYHSFGALGPVLGRIMHRLIDEIGRRYDQSGTRLNSERGWWSSNTLVNYNKARQCVANVYNNITQGPYIFSEGDHKTIYVNGEKFAGHAMAITSGIRMAYNAYKSWTDKHGEDPYPPSLQHTPQQLFFLAHAQTYCYNMHPVIDYYWTRYWQHANYETRVNVPLMELPEFGTAYGCKVTDRMVSAKPCTYY